MPTTTAHVPLILIRGFGGLDTEDERRVAYQGFNDGTVYPHKRGENYIYEGFVLKYLKSQWKYHDATNVVGYYASAITEDIELPEELNGLKREYFTGDRVVIDPGTALALVNSPEDPRKSLWVFRYYDLDDRSFEVYGKSLVRLIDFVRDLTVIKTGHPKPPVNIIAHSMGGLIVREAVQCTFPAQRRRAEDHINKIVTLGTPHQGITFQGIRDWKFVEADEELERFNPKAQANRDNPWAFVNFEQALSAGAPADGGRDELSLLRHADRDPAQQVLLAPHEYGWNYNRSDGLVKQSSAQLPGAPRTFVHKCHGGDDSIVTARESFEVATRFFHGDAYARINLLSAEVKRGFDWIGKSEIFFGVSIKPRRVDFDLFHQSAEAENCYGPFRTGDLTDDLSAKEGFGWAGPDRLIWEGWFDTSRINPAAPRPRPVRAAAATSSCASTSMSASATCSGWASRTMSSSGSRYYIRVVAAGAADLSQSLDQVELFLYRDENFGDTAHADQLVFEDGRWPFAIEGTGFVATLGIRIDRVDP